MWRAKHFEFELLKTKNNKKINNTFNSTFLTQIFYYTTNNKKYIRKIFRQFPN